MSRVHPNSMGLAFGVFLAVWHAFWSLLVFVGVAQWLIDFVFRLHMIAPPYRVTGFSPLTALSLVLVTSIVGYLIGTLLALIWNRFAVVTKQF
jgi:hypothetical protein